MRYNEILNELRSLRAGLNRVEQRVEERGASEYETAPAFVESGSREGVYHAVRLQYTCTCESFRYKAGLDSNGHCKHIREYLRGC